MNVRSSLTDFKEVEIAQILFSQTSKVIFFLFERFIILLISKFGAV